MSPRSDTGPFAMVPVWVLDAPISDRAVRLYAVMRRYADKDKGECWPARKTIAGRLRCSVDSIDRAMTELIDLEAIVVTPRQGKKGNLPNLYTVCAAMRPPVGNDAARGMGTTAAQNYSQIELYADTTYLRAARIVDPWWATQNPRPQQPYIAIRKAVERALKSGWSDEEIHTALQEVPTVSGASLDYWRNRARTTPGTPTSRTHENMRRYLARTDGEAGSDVDTGAHAGELGPRGAE